jgi:hypothetical protein
MWPLGFHVICCLFAHESLFPFFLCSDVTPFRTVTAVLGKMLSNKILQIDLGHFNQKEYVPNLKEFFLMQLRLS